MQKEFGNYEIDDDLSRIDFEKVHEWLSSTYWSPGVARERVERAAQFSAMVVGVYQDRAQVGYLRIVSDRTTFAWLCDVFVDPCHRKRGLAKAMVQFALTHPDYQTIRRWLLATADAHEIYHACGFDPLTNPERWMTLVPKRP